MKSSNSRAQELSRYTLKVLNILNFSLAYMQKRLVEMVQVNKELCSSVRHQVKTRFSSTSK